MASPEFTAIRDALRDNPPALVGDDVVDARRAMEDLMAGAPLADGTTSENLTVGGLPAVRITPSCQEGGVMLYLHGGGYRIGSAACYRGFGSYLAVAAGATVVIVDYRLAPEDPFPAAVDDAVAAYRALLDAGTPPSRLAIAGDSAGGGLSVATLLALRDAGLPQPAAAVCISPWADLTVTAGSYDRCAPTDPYFSRAQATVAAAGLPARRGSEEPARITRTRRSLRSRARARARIRLRGPRRRRRAPRRGHRSCRRRSRARAVAGDDARVARHDSVRAGSTRRGRPRRRIRAGAHRRRLSRRRARRPASSERLDLSSLKPGMYTAICAIVGHVDAGDDRDAARRLGGSTSNNGARGFERPTRRRTEEAGRCVRRAADERREHRRVSGAQVLAPKVLADGTKEFDLTAKITDWEVSPARSCRRGRTTGTVPGATIKVQPGDHVRVVLDNQLPQSTADRLPWHRRVERDGRCPVRDTGPGEAGGEVHRRLRRQGARSRDVPLAPPRRAPGARRPDGRDHHRTTSRSTCGRSNGVASPYLVDTLQTWRRGERLHGPGAMRRIPVSGRGTATSSPTPRATTACSAWSTTFIVQ